MAYDINLTDGTLLVTIPNNTVVPAGAGGGVLDLTLYGKGKQNYGEQWNENFVHLLENFANSVAPQYPLEGQFWFDTSGSPPINILYLRSGGIWDAVGTLSSGVFVAITGDTMTGDLEFTLPLTGDSAGLRFVGADDEARIYVDKDLPQTSSLRLTVGDDYVDNISFRALYFSDTFDTEILQMKKDAVNGYGIMYMSKSDGTNFDPGTAVLNGERSITFNEGGGNVADAADIRFQQSGLLSAGDHMIFNIEDNVSTVGTVGTPTFYFNKGTDSFPGLAQLATIDNDGAFRCAMDATASGGTADWFLGGSSGTRIDFGSFNNNIRSLRASRQNGIAGAYQARVRVEAADAINSYDLTTLSQVTGLISGSGGVVKSTSGPIIMSSSNANILQYAHGLGAEPDFVSVIAECVIAEHGWSIGDRVQISNGTISWQSQADANIGYGITTQVDPTYVRVYMSAGGSGDGTPWIWQKNLNGNFGDTSHLTYAYWRIYIKAIVVA